MNKGQEMATRSLEAHPNLPQIPKSFSLIGVVDGREGNQTLLENSQALYLKTALVILLQVPELPAPGRTRGGGSAQEASLVLRGLCWKLAAAQPRAPV